MTDPTHKSPIKLRHVILIVNLTKVAVTVQRQGVGSNHTFNYVVSQFQHYQIFIVKCFRAGSTCGGSSHFFTLSTQVDVALRPPLLFLQISTLG